MLAILPIQPQIPVRPKPRETLSDTYAAVAAANYLDKSAMRKVDRLTVARWCAFLRLTYPKPMRLPPRVAPRAADAKWQL